MWMVYKQSSFSRLALTYFFVGTDSELLKEGNRVFREFSFLVGHVGLLSSTLALLVLQKDEPCDDFIDWLYINRKNRLKNNEQNDDFFELLGLIHRYKKKVLKITNTHLGLFFYYHAVDI